MAGPGVSLGRGLSEGPSHTPTAPSITALCVVDPRGLPQPAVRAEVGYPVYLVGLPLHCPAADRARLPCPAGPRERHGPSTPGGQLPGARRGPGPRRPAPLPAQPPGALGGGLRPLLPAAYLCAPTAPPAVTAALGAPRWPGGPRSRPRGPRPDGECLPPTRDAGSWGKRDPEEPGKGERVGGGGEPAGPLGGCGQCGLCVARSRKTEWEAGGWGEALA